MGTGWLISSPGISLSAGHQWSLLVALLLWGLPLLLNPAGVYMPELQSTSYLT